jgi:tight adherence protein C
MEYIDIAQNLLVEKFGPMGPLFAIGLLGLFLVLMTIPILLRKRVDPMDKLSTKTKTTENTTTEAKVERQQLKKADASKKLDKFASFLEPQDQSQFSAAQLKLVQAGYHGRGVVRAFHFMQFSLGLGGLFFGMLYTFATSDGDFSLNKVLLQVIVPAGAGYYLPSYWVERRRQARIEQITEGFPDSLDLMLVCVEAGQSLDQSIVRVSKEMRAGFPALAEEFEMVSYEVKAGKDKVNVLRDMAERASAADISSFVTVMIQSATFGTSISDALRVFSEEMRDKRVMRAEEKANKLPTKLTLGTMMFTVPPLLIIMIGPSVVGIIEMLG